MQAARSFTRRGSGAGSCLSCAGCPTRSCFARRCELMKTRRSSAAWVAITLAGAALLAILLYYPLRDARPYADDNLFIALSRNLEEPWQLLLRDVLGQFH